MSNILPVTLDQLAAQYEVTEAGIKLLTVLVDPEARTLTVKRICELAGINKGSYYNLFRDPRFVDCYYAACKMVAVTAAMPTMHSVAKQASEGDSASAKMILEMNMLYAPTSRVEQHVTHDIGPNLLQQYRDHRKAIT
jgi:hypothetical protein